MTRVCKPNFVPRFLKNRGGNYLSRRDIAIAIQRSTRRVTCLSAGIRGEQPRPEKYSGNLLLDLAPSGVYHAIVVTTDAVSSYLTFSPLPRFTPGRYFFCGTFRIPKKEPRELPGTLFCGVRTFLYSRRYSSNSNCPARIINCSSCSFIYYLTINFQLR